MYTRHVDLKYGFTPEEEEQEEELVEEAEDAMFNFEDDPQWVGPAAVEANSLDAFRAGLRCGMLMNRYLYDVTLQHFPMLKVMEYACMAPEEFSKRWEDFRSLEKDLYGFVTITQEWFEKIATSVSTPNLIPLCVDVTGWNKVGALKRKLCPELYWQEPSEGEWVVYTRHVEAGLCRC